jgi:hypothetical protein
VIAFKAAEFKWAGYGLPNAHVPPGKARPFDAFFLLHDEPTRLQFNSFSTATDFIPRIQGSGRYRLTYAVISDNFPIARASFFLTLDDSLGRTTFAAD